MDNVISKERYIEIYKMMRFINMPVVYHSGLESFHEEYSVMINGTMCSLGHWGLDRYYYKEEFEGRG